MGHTFSFDIRNTRVDVSKTDDGELEIYCQEGRILVIPHSANVVRLRPEPMWSREDTVSIVAHAGKISEQRADRIVARLRQEGS